MIAPARHLNTKPKCNGQSGWSVSKRLFGFLRPLNELWGARKVSLSLEYFRTLSGFGSLRVVLVPRLGFFSRLSIDGLLPSDA